MGPLAPKPIAGMGCCSSSSWLRSRGFTLLSWKAAGLDPSDGLQEVRAWEPPLGAEACPVTLHVAVAGKARTEAMHEQGLLCVGVGGDAHLLKRSNQEDPQANPSLCSIFKPCCSSSISTSAWDTHQSDTRPSECQLATTVATLMV
eukprot:1160125-Pelagomonas_calceolata.AAC.12